MSEALPARLGRFSGSASVPMKSLSSWERASSEWPTSSKGSVASLPASVRRTSSPPGCCGVSRCDCSDTYFRQKLCHIVHCICKISYSIHTFSVDRKPEIFLRLVLAELGVRDLTGHELSCGRKQGNKILLGLHPKGTYRVNKQLVVYVIGRRSRRVARGRSPSLKCAYFHW